MQAQQSVAHTLRGILIFIVMVCLTGAVLGQNSRNASLHDPISEFARRVENNEARLEYSQNGWGYLPSLLKQLDLNIDSQILVFSKTSFQLTKIAPQTPRAIYFN